MSNESVALMAKANTLNLIEYASLNTLPISAELGNITVPPDLQGLSESAGPALSGASSASYQLTSIGSPIYAFALSSLPDFPNLVSNDLSWSWMWRPNDIGTNKVIWQTDGVVGLLRYSNTQKLTLNDHAATEIPIVVGATYHIVVTFSSTTGMLTVYVDGVELHTDTYNSAVHINNQYTTRIGTYNSCTDVLMTFNRHLTPTDVSELYTLITATATLEIPVRMNFKRLITATDAATIGADYIVMLNEGMANDELRVQFTDMDGLVLKELMSSTRLNTKIINSLTGFNTVKVAEDMDARDLLGTTNNVMVLVNDPRTGVNADATVSTGGALYFYDATDGNPATAWLKIMEDESMGDYSWAGISDKPAATNPQWEALVSDTHIHPNHATLEGVIEDADGNMQYNNISLNGTVVIEAYW